MTGALIMMGGMLAFAAIVVTWDLIAQRHNRRLDRHRLPRVPSR